MTRKLLELCVAGAVIAAALIAPATAPANWTTNGTTTGVAFTAPSIAANGPALFWQLQNTTGGVANWPCAGASLSGTLFGPSQSTGISLASVTPVFAMCQAGGFAIPMRCSASPFNAATYSASLTMGSLASVTCNAVQPIMHCGNATTITGGFLITGTLGVSYGNTSQQMTFPLVSQALTASWPAACLNFAGTGTAQLVTSSGTAPIYGMTSTFKPQITN